MNDRYSDLRSCTHRLKKDCTAARISADGKQVELTLDGMQPTWCMEIKYQLRGADDEPVEGVIHNTVHQTP